MGSYRSGVLTAILWVLAVGPGAAQTTVTRVSTDAGGIEVAGASRQPSASADGRYVAFASTATTLVPSDANGSSDIFVKDRQTGAVSRVSVKSDGTEATGDSVAPDISADGRFITFVSSAALVSDDANPSQCAGGTPGAPTCPDVYVHDRTTGATTRVSLAGDGTQANAASASPHITADGRYVVFESIADNLVGGDTNQAADVFLRDRQTGTTTRESVSTSGVQSDRPAISPTISEDGGRLVFLSEATTLDETPDTLPCAPLLLACTRVYVRTVAAGVTARVPLTDPNVLEPFKPVKQAYRASSPVIAGDGETIALILDGVSPDATQSSNISEVLVYSLATGMTKGVSSISSPPPFRERFTNVGVSRTGRTVAVCYGAYPNDTFVVLVADVATGLQSTGAPPTTQYGPAQPDCEGMALTDDGNVTFFASSGASIVSGDANGARDVFAFDRDPDRDGIPSEWEGTFGLNHSDGTDGALDSDADGSTNRQEFEAGTHPKGLFKRYLAEGADNSFFSTEIDVFNPNPSTTPSGSGPTVVAQFLGQNGRTSVSRVSTLYQRSSGLSLLRLASTYYPGLFPDLSFSTVVESDEPVAVERTLTWGGPLGVGYGSHAETGVTGPATTWFFAEGATHGRFDLFYLLQNPSNSAATATVTYLRPAPLSPIVHTYALLPNSRRTIWVDQEPGLEASDVSARVDADRPIFAERSMYLSTPDEPFAGGTSSAGIGAPATQWFIAEGATGTFFDLYILIGNPSQQDAAVTVTYLLPEGTSIEKTYQVAALSRLTISVDGEDARLADTPVSATITSTNATPIVVERALWWPSPSWYEGTVTAATTQAAPRWALAGAYIDPRPDAETYLLIANPSDTAANVTIDVGINGNPGQSPVPLVFGCRVTVPVAARARYTTGLKSLCAVTATNLTLGIRVAGLIESDGPGIVVERATYWSTATQFWAAGASTLLTRLP